MIKAYTLSDRISQQNYNDYESMVGLVFKSAESGNGPILQSSIEELKAAAGIAQNVVPQVYGFVYLGDPALNTAYDTPYAILSGDGVETSVIRDMFNFWGPNRQFIQIRSASVNFAPDSTTASPKIVLKITADAYTAN